MEVASSIQYKPPRWTSCYLNAMRVIRWNKSFLKAFSQQNAQYSVVITVKFSCFWWALKDFTLFVSCIEDNRISCDMLDWFELGVYNAGNEKHGNFLATKAI